MVWFNVDDGFAFHRKALRAGNAAIGLWTRAGAECGRQLTDGFVSTMLARQMGKPAEIRALVDVELWHRAEHVDKCPECVEHGMLEVVARAAEPGFVFHEWWLRNRSREQVEKERAEARDRMKRARTKPPRSGERSGEVRANERRTNAEVPGSDPGQARPGQAQTPLLTLVGRLAVSDARDAGPPPAEQIALWQDIAGPGTDLEAEARAYLERNLGRPARDEAAAWVGWLRAGARRREAQVHDAAARLGGAPPLLVPARTPCTTPGCADGWLPDDPDTGAPRPCPTCRPHLRAVPNQPHTEAS
jgi:hypothetical protein